MVRKTYFPRDFFVREFFRGVQGKCNYIRNYIKFGKIQKWRENALDKVMQNIYNRGV